MEKKDYDFEIIKNDLIHQNDDFDEKIIQKYRKIANNNEDTLLNKEKNKTFILINIINSLLIQKLTLEKNKIIHNLIDYKSKIIHIEYEKI